MYSISDEYKIACKKLTRQSRSKVVIDNVTYDGSKYIKDYPKFSHSNETMIGGFPIKSAEFSLWIKEGFIDVINKEIKIYRGLVINEEVTWIPQGVFIAQNEDVTTSDTGEYITVKCYDKAKEAGTKTYVDNNAYPISESNYIKNVISQSGYELDENVFVESNYMMRQKPNMPVDTSVREIISRYAEQRGAIALFSRLGKIQIKRPTEIDLSYKFYEYKKLTCEKLYGPLNQVILGNKNINNNVVWPEGEQTFPWTINDNPFLDLIKLDRNQEIYNQVNNLELTPFALESALDVFFLDVNDIIAIEKKDKTIQKVTILSIETENRLKCKIGASVQNKSNIAYELAGSVKKDLELVRFDVDYNKNEINALVSKTETNSKKIDTLNPIKSASGNPVFLQNSAGKDIPKLVIKGNSFQEVDPSPDNPCEIKTITGNRNLLNSNPHATLYGNWLEINCRGKNLFDKNKANYTTAVPDVNEITSDANFNRSFYIKIKPNTSYAISREKIGSRFVIGTTANIPNIGEQILDRVVRNKEDKVIIHSSPSAKYLIVYYLYNQSENEEEILNTIQIEEGEAATIYEEYKRKISLVDLNEYDEEGHIISHYELAKIGDIYDELEVVSGNLTKRIGKIESYNNEEITTDYISSTGILSSGATVYYVLKEEQHINLRFTKVSTFEDDCYIEIDDELIDFFCCDYYTKSKITEYFETQKDSEAKMEILNDSITQKVSEVTTTVKNSEMAFNEKLNDFATNESVEQQISSVENKITSSEQKITIINELLENGISQIRTEKGYTFNDQGLTIDDSNSKVQNKLAENGMTIIDKSSNTTLLFAGYDETSQETIVKAENMTVEKYFVAPNCRFEEYNNPNHGKGTGVFSL